MKTAYRLSIGIACSLLALPAQAESDIFSSVASSHNRANVRTASSAHKKTKPKSATRVMAYEKRSEQPQVKCLEPVRVIGSQFVTEQGAEESAQKAWMEAVRYDSGEQYMMLDNAQGYSHRCSRSSIGEIAGQVFYRCEVIAKPCRPLLVLGRDK